MSRLLEVKGRANGTPANSENTEAKHPGENNSKKGVLDAIDDAAYTFALLGEGKPLPWKQEDYLNICAKLVKAKVYLESIL